MGPPERGPDYLSANDVVALHAELFDITPEQGADRLRSRSVLEGAVARPRQHAHYAGADLAVQAAVLVHGIAEGQPFIETNGRTLAVTEAALADRILRLSRDVSSEEFAEWIRTSLVLRKEP